MGAGQIEAEIEVELYIQWSTLTTMIFQERSGDSGRWLTGITYSIDHMILVNQYKHTQFVFLKGDIHSQTYFDVILSTLTVC